MAAWIMPGNMSLAQMVNRAMLPVIDRVMMDAGAFLCNEVLGMIQVIGPPRSKPGQPPHVDTGKLFLSIAYQYDWTQHRTVVVADTSYAQKLEFGGFSHRYGGVLHWQEPRPFMRRSLFQFATERNLRRCFRNAMNPGYVVDTSMMRHDII